MGSEGAGALFAVPVISATTAATRGFVSAVRGVREATEAVLRCFLFVAEGIVAVVAAAAAAVAVVVADDEGVFEGDEADKAANFELVRERRCNDDIGEETPMPESD